MDKEHCFSISKRPKSKEKITQDQLKTFKRIKIIGENLNFLGNKLIYGFEVISSIIIENRKLLP